MKNSLRQFTAWLSMPVVLFILVVRIAKHFSVLRRARVVIIAEGGHGHSILGPDIARRIFREDPPVFIMFSDYGRHNEKVAKIWHDLSVIFVPLTFGLKFRNRIFRTHHALWLERLAERVIRGVIAALTSSRKQFMSLHDLCLNVPVSEGIRLLAESQSASFQLPVRYFQLLRQMDVRRVGLPAVLSGGVELKLREELARCSSSLTQWCCLYLRQKGKGSTDITDKARSGSPLEDYLPAVRLLNAKGYVVLLTGDVTLDVAPHVDGVMLYDAESLGQDKGIFDLFAATETDIFIGEAGGGSWLSGINGIPRLLLNGFPYGYGMPDSWVYYKTARDSDGHLVHYSKLFSEHTYDYDLEGMTLNRNSSDEIYAAVVAFLDGVSNFDGSDPHADVLPCFPAHAMIRHARNARISPAFIQKYSMCVAK